MKVCVIILLCISNAMKADEAQYSNNVAQNGPQTPNGVYVLTDDNFDLIVNERQPILVEFYAPWCGHCMKLEPAYAQAAVLLSDKKSKASLAKIDATVHTKAANRFKVAGYPTIKFFAEGVDGSVIDYDGSRDTEGIVEWLSQKTDPDYKPPASIVQSLTVENFANAVDSADIALVEFYAPWCGHCKQLAPEYEKAAKRLTNLPKPIPLYKVDATVERELSEKFNVRGYPTLKIFRRGKSLDYNGPREAEGIVQFMITRSMPAAQEIVTVEEVDRMWSKDDVTIFGFFEKTKHDEFLEAYKEACEANRDEFHHLFYTFETDVINKLKGQRGRIGIYYPERYWSKYEPKTVFYTEDGGSREDISKFLLEKCTPLVGERTVANMDKRYFNKPLVVAYFTVDFSHHQKDETQFWRQKILNVARNFPSLKFAVSDEDRFQFELADVGLTDSGLDVNVVIHDADGRRYLMQPEQFDEFDEEAFSDFLQQFVEGKLKPYIKSQPIPKYNDDPVKVLVGKNIDEVANDESKDVFIEFYAPWCGHCKALAPLYEQLAAKYQHDPHLIIAKIDGSANDVPRRFNVGGFPTLYLVQSGRKSTPLLFEGARTLEAMEEFLVQNAVVSFGKGDKNSDDRDEL